MSYRCLECNGRGLVIEAEVILNPNEDLEGNLHIRVEKEICCLQCKGKGKVDFFKHCLLLHRRGMI